MLERISPIYSFFNPDSKTSTPIPCRAVSYPFARRPDTSSHRAKKAFNCRYVLVSTLTPSLLLIIHVQLTSSRARFNSHS